MAAVGVFARRRPAGGGAGIPAVAQCRFGPPARAGRRVRLPLGHDVVVSAGKSRDAVRTVDLDDGLVGVLRTQQALQAAEQPAVTKYEESSYVFTRPGGGAYHPQRLYNHVTPTMQRDAADRIGAALFGPVGSSGPPPGSSAAASAPADAGSI